MNTENDLGPRLYEKFVDIDSVYNLQNDQVWAVNHADANEKNGIKQKRKFSQKLMVPLDVCSKSITLLVILDEEAIDHAVYIEKMVRVALKYENQVFGNDWVFQ